MSMLTLRNVISVHLSKNIKPFEFSLSIILFAIKTEIVSSVYWYTPTVAS